MLITDRSELNKYGENMRIWQGMPSIEVTKNKRTFVAFCTNGTAESLDNFVLLMYSDGNNNFQNIAAAKAENHRCFDPCLWIDPLDRLWFVWSYEPDHAVYATICENPDDEKIKFGKVFKIGNDVMLNKPSVLSTGEWLFPVAVWDKGIRVIAPKYDTKQPVRGSFVYKTNDNGKTFTKLGFADVPNRSYDEHIILELNDLRLMMLVRTSYGIGVSYSYDRGKTWTKGEDSGLGGPCSRFHIRRLKSGRILLINNVSDGERNNLTAMLSEDEGKTWKYKLLLDERDNVAGPDATQTDDGIIYIIYDYDRGSFAKNLGEAQKCAREILTAQITEEDIIQGKTVSENSYLKKVVSKLKKYEGNDNPYKRQCDYSNRELALQLIKLPNKEDIIEAVFDEFPLDTSKSHKLDIKKFDKMVENFEKSNENEINMLTEIISFLRNSVASISNYNPIVERIKEIISQDLTMDINLQDIATGTHTGVYYACHIFKKVTGTTISDYRNSLRLIKAKKLLVSTDMKITEICNLCGYSDQSYFSKLFKKTEGISPKQYREFNTVKNME